MTDPPFGFGLPGDPDRDRDDPGNSPGGGGGSGGSGGSGGRGGGSGGPQGPLGPLGPLGDPQQFADALRQFADLMSWQGGPVNWDLAKNVARQTVAAAGEWVEATLPVWSKLCDPIAARAVDVMGGMLADDPEELAGELPPEMRSVMGALTGGLGGALGGLGQMMRRIGGMMVGGQTGAAVGALAQEVVSSTDVGLPLGPAGTAALLPAGVAAFGQGLSVDDDEVRLFLALREAAHHRLFAHVPWLRARLLGAVEDYARGITVDANALREAMPQIDPANPEALNEALAGAALFQPEDTEQQKAALARLETMLALVEGWVATAVDAAAAERLPQAGALAEAIRRRRASGGPAERTFATLVGLDLRPRRLREAAVIWRGLTDARGISGRDAIWAHPDLLPTADDFDDPDGFVRGRPELDISAFESPAEEPPPPKEGEPPADPDPPDDAPR